MLRPLTSGISQTEILPILSVSTQEKNGRSYHFFPYLPIPHHRLPITHYRLPITDYPISRDE